MATPSAPHLTPPGPSPVAAAPALPVFSLADALRYLDGSLEGLAEVAAQVEQDTPGLVARLREGLRQSDAAAVRAAAHSLKGMLAVLAAQAASAVAESIEAAARQGRLAEASVGLPQLEAALARLWPVLRAALAPPTS